MNEEEFEDATKKPTLLKVPKETENFKNIIFTQEQTYTADGPENLKYEWEPIHGAWFPIISEQTLQSQQSIYTQQGIDENEPVLHITQRRAAFRRETKAQPKAVKIRKNTGVYVTNLPQETTIESLVALFSKYGVILEDIDSGEPKIKLYKNDAGDFKGEALVVYFKEESVKLAVQMLDDTPFNPYPHIIKVQPAVYEEKAGEKHVYSKSIIKNKLKHMSKKFDWDDGADDKKLKKLNKRVILKHMFTLQNLIDDPALILELKEDVREECERIGAVTNVVLYEESKDGAMSVNFKEQDHASECIKVMNGRFFGGRKVDAFLHDGDESEFNGKKNVEKSEVEKEEDEAKRMAAYQDWLESEQNS